MAARILLSEIGRILGHQQPGTTYRYTNLTEETARKAAAALDALNVPHGSEEAERAAH